MTCDRHRRYAVTGATGWLGRAASEVLATRLVAGGASPRESLLLFGSREGSLALDAGPTLRVAPLEELPESSFDVLLHYAYVTRDFLGKRGLHNFVTANVGISATVVAALASQRPEVLVLASSGAASRAAAERASLRDDPYGVLKLLDELAMRRASADAGARCLTLRVYNVSGPWITKPGTFALSDLIVQAHAGGPIQITAKHPVRRSYVDVEDLASIAINFADHPPAGNDVVVETLGEEVLEVGDLAEIVAKALHPTGVRIERTYDASLPPDDYFARETTFHQLAHSVGVTLRPLAEQVQRTADYLRSGAGGRGAGATVERDRTVPEWNP